MTAETSKSGFNADHRIQFGCGIVLLALLLAVGVPEGYRRYDARRAVHASLDSVTVVQAAISAYWQDNQRLPSSLQELLGGVEPVMRNVSDMSWTPSGWLIIKYDSTVQEHLDLEVDATVALKATASDTGVEWDCRYGTVGNWYRPEGCRVVER
jgi:hypothetical protein